MVRRATKTRSPPIRTTAWSCLADGMGGYNAGEVASGMATTVILSEMREVLASTQPNQIDPRTNQTIAARLVREQVLRANSSIYQAAQTQPQYAGHGHHARGLALLRQPGAGGAPGRLAPVPPARRRAAPGHARSFAAAGADRLGPPHRRAANAQHKNLVTKALGIDPSASPSTSTPAPGRPLSALLGRPVRHGGGRRSATRCRRSAAT